ncbi:hypothetical protein Tco_0881647 [Tanacetum coccineum]
MANLEFCDTHNMVAYLHKIEGSEGFHPIVDFLNTSHIKYAVTENPTIHVLLIQEFWQTTAANTIDSREVQITATIDGKVKLISEASIRRHLKLEDSAGITTLPNTKIFEQLTLLGEWEDRMEMAATTASSLEIEQDNGSGPRCQVTILGVQKLKLGLRLHLNSPMIHLSQELTHLEVGRTA